MVDHLAGTVTDAEAPVDVDLGAPVDGDHKCRHQREPGVTRQQLQRGAAFITLTRRGWPSSSRVFSKEPAGAGSRLMVTARVSAAM